MSEQTDNAAAIIIIIDDLVAQLQAIRASSLETLSLKLQGGVDDALKGAQALTAQAQALATS